MTAPAQTKFAVRLVAHGERVVSVDPHTYEQAKRSGTLDVLFVDEVDQTIDDAVAVVVVDPDGDVTELTGLACQTRPSLMNGLSTVILQTMIESARPDPGCEDCSTAACPRHLAEHLMRQARAERLLLVPADI